MPHIPDPAALIALAHDLAGAARRETLAAFRPPGGIAAQNKREGGFDPVTEADRAAEAAMRALIEAARPEDAIFGEEFGPRPGTSGLSWVLDPIDGTRGFMSGTPTWGVLVALAEDGPDGPGAPLFGVIDQPYIGERFWGGFGQAGYSGPQGQGALATRATGRLDDATLFTTFPEVGTPAEGAAFARLAGQVRLTRYGMDCYAYALLAAGQIDLVVEAGLQPYDIAAPLAVITAAGGLVTDWQGGPAHRGGQVIAAANPTLHAAALAVLNG